MVVSSQLRNALSDKVLADFTAYFVFIESLPQADAGHKHHILPKKEFPEFAKNPNNLIRLTPSDHFRAHYWLAVCASKCESFQRTFFLLANRKFATQISEKDLPQHVEIFERGRKAQSEMARVNGRILGRKNVESGHLASLRTPEHQKAAAHKAGLVGGCTTRDLGKGIFAPGMQILASKLGCSAGGRRNVELHGCPATPEGRLKSGRKAVESGQLAKVNHNRWHVNRNKVSPTCLLCEGIQ